MSNHWSIIFYHIIDKNSYWTYFWKHYICNKKDTKFGSQNFGYQIWFCTRLTIGNYTVQDTDKCRIHIRFWIRQINLVVMLLVSEQGSHVSIQAWKFAKSLSLQERCNSSALAMELCLSCINPSKCCWQQEGLIDFFSMIAVPKIL